MNLSHFENIEEMTLIIATHGHILIRNSILVTVMTMHAYGQRSRGQAEVNAKNCRFGQILAFFTFSDLMRHKTHPKNAQFNNWL